MNSAVRSTPRPRCRSSCPDADGRAEDAGPPSQLQADSKLFRHLIYTEFNEFATGEIEAGQIGHGEAVRRGK